MERDAADGAFLFGGAKKKKEMLKPSSVYESASLKTDYSNSCVCQTVSCERLNPLIIRQKQQK